MQYRLTGNLKSVVGAALLGVGVFVLYGNLGHMARQLSHLCSAPCDATAGLPTFFLTVWQDWRAYPADQKRFLHALLRHMLISSWPLLLVMAGTALSRDAFAEEQSPLPEKNIGGVVDLIGRRSTSK